MAWCRATLSDHRHIPDGGVPLPIAESRPSSPGRLDKRVAGLTLFLMTEQLERLALGGWGDAAEAQVVSVTVAGNRAEVALRVDAYEYWMYFKRGVDGSWSEVASSNAATDGWDDVSLFEW